MDVVLHARESDRLLSLQAYNLVSGEKHLSFDQLTRRAADVCDAPIALISVVEKNRQWYLSRFGEDSDRTPRTESVCSDAVASGQPLVVHDLTRVSRYAGLPSVTGPHGYRAYAGIPLIGREGLPLGTLCVLDIKPRDFTPLQLAHLEQLAQRVVTGLELRRDQAIEAVAGM